MRIANCVRVIATCIVSFAGEPASNAPTAVIPNSFRGEGSAFAFAFAFAFSAVGALACCALRRAASKIKSLTGGGLLHSTTSRVLTATAIAVILVSASPARAQKPAGITSPNTTTPSEPQSSNSNNLPTAAAYSRPTAGQKWKHFVREAIGPYTLVKTVAVAGVLQAEDEPPDWGEGGSGFGDRLGSEYGRFLAEISGKYAIAAALHQDTKYYVCECTGFGHRLGHALHSTFTARAGDDGHYVISPAPIAAPYVGSFTELAWYPDRFGWKDAVRTGSYGLLYDGAANIAHEFLGKKFKFLQ